MRLELGVHHLVELGDVDAKAELFLWLQRENDIDHWLDGVELSLQIVDKAMRDQEIRSLYSPSAEPDDVIDEFNARLLEAAVGYQYASGEIIHIDSHIFIVRLYSQFFDC